MKSQRGSADRVLSILKERKGFSWWWDACDEDDREEILQEINKMHDYVTGNPSRQWDYCPTCGGELDTGFECLSCEIDWRQWAIMKEGVSETEDDQ